MELKIIRSAKLKDKPIGPLGFGKYFTDHMFIMEYSDGQWRNARIQPYGPLTLQPSATVFHYGQEAYEGAKAYKNEAGEIRLFRIRDNLKRMNESCDRICVPKIDVDFVYDAIVKLVLIDGDWIPTADGTALYIRPTVIASEEALGLHVSDKYIFFVILSPVGSYYDGGLSPIGLYVENKFVRAVKGGTGNTKVGGNYAASLKAGENAKKAGYAQVMWLDAVEHKYVEEVGSMNIFFVLDGKVVTPELCGSILPGITRSSAIELLTREGYDVQERRVSIDEVIEGVKSGTCTEVFGTGTAAVISPVGRLHYDGAEYVVGDGKMGNVAAHLYDELTGIQTGKIPDKYGWVIKIL